MFRTLGRIAAAASLLFATVAIATVASSSTAGAANTNVTADCSTAPAIQSINNNDTLTITVGAGCGAVIVMDNAGGTVRWEQMSMYVSEGAPLGGLQQGDTITYTAPASGSGSAAIGFMANAQAPPAITFSVNFPVPAPPTPRNDSLTDNGDGSLTVNYSPVTLPEIISLNLFASGTTCDPTGNPANRLFGISSSSSQALPVLAASPAVLSAGSPMRSGWANTTAASTLVAGSYQACLYYYNGQQSNVLVQSLAVTIGTVTPTTAPSGDPVAPAFTG